MGDIDEVHCYGLRSGVSQDYPQEDNFVINVKFESGKIGRIANFLNRRRPVRAPTNRERANAYRCGQHAQPIWMEEVHG